MLREHFDIVVVRQPLPRTMVLCKVREAPAGNDGDLMTEDTGETAVRDAPRSWRQQAKRWVHWIGALVTIAAIVFIAYEVWSRASRLSEFADPTFIGALAAAAAVCGLCGFLMVLGWRLALLAASDRTLSAREAISVYGRSNILKYLPSNVLHFAGRYAMLLARGFAHRAIVASTITEHALLVTAALALAILFGAPVLLQNLAETGDQESLVIVLAIAAAVGLIAGTWFLFARGLRERATSVLASGGLMVATTLVYLVYFLALGGIATALAGVAGSPVGGSEYFTITGILSAAFIVGLVTPGAPAGLGVREAIMILAFQATPFADEGLVIALGFRVATLGGDLILALIGFALGRGQSANGDP